MGIRAGIAYSGLDDFDVIYPLFDNEYRVSYSNKETIDGSALGSIFSTTPFSDASVYIQDFYSYFLRHTINHTAIDNLTDSDKPTLLVVGDSYIRPIVAFLASMFGHIDFIWPLDENYHTNLEKIITSNTYDYIIIEAYEGNIKKDEMFDYFRSADKSEIDIIDIDIIDIDIIEENTNASQE
jgi:hypothetical protein